VKRPEKTFRKQVQDALEKRADADRSERKMGEALAESELHEALERQARATELRASVALGSGLRIRRAR
jgi:hypothetical protein